MSRLNGFLIYTCLIFFLFMLANSVHATMTGDKIGFNFSGRLLLASTPCVVNNNKEINVQFDNVGINKVVTGQYIKDIDYTLDCGNATETSTVHMKISAIPTDWDTKAMSSDVDGLGVRVLSSSQAVDLNSAITINPAAPPHLQAQLVKKSDVTLTEQPFSATGSLIVEYQ